MCVLTHHGGADTCQRGDRGLGAGAGGAEAVREDTAVQAGTGVYGVGMDSDLDAHLQRDGGTDRQVEGQIDREAVVTVLWEPSMADVCSAGHEGERRTSRLGPQGPG